MCERSRSREGIVEVCVVRVMAVDPGVTSGWVVGHVANGAVGGVVDLGQVVGPGWHGGWGCVASAKDLVAIGLGYGCKMWVIEDFVLHGGGHSSERAGLEPVRVTSAMLVMLEDRGVVCLSAVSGKSVITDDRLKRWGLWEPGKPHAMDAMRHLVLYARSSA